MNFRILTLCVTYALLQMGGHLLASDITHSPLSQEENYKEKIYDELIQEDEGGFTGLMNLASEKNKAQKIKDYLSLFSLDEIVALLKKQGWYNFTPTHTAIANSNIEGLEALLDSIKEDKEACKEIVYKISGGNDLSLARYLHEQCGAPQMEDLIRSYIPALSKEEEEEVTRQYNNLVRGTEPNMENPQDQIVQNRNAEEQVPEEEIRVIPWDQVDDERRAQIEAFARRARFQMMIDRRLNGRVGRLIREGLATLGLLFHPFTFISY